MRDDDMGTDHAPELDRDQPYGYESPRLWEYGTLRVTTAGPAGGGNLDAGVNFSAVA